MCRNYPSATSQSQRSLSSHKGADTKKMKTLYYFADSCKRPFVFVTLSQAPSAKASGSRTGARACSEYNFLPDFPRYVLCNSQDNAVGSEILSFSPSRDTRTLSEMPRELTKATLNDHRRDFPRPTHQPVLLARHTVLVMVLLFVRIVQRVN